MFWRVKSTTGVIIKKFKKERDSALSYKLFQVKIAVEVLLMLHLVSAFPIIVNPNNQFFEELLGFPKGKIPFMVKN